jgi:hypothetical protein
MNSESPLFYQYVEKLYYHIDDPLNISMVSLSAPGFFVDRQIPGIVSHAET